MRGVSCALLELRDWGLATFSVSFPRFRHNSSQLVSSPSQIVGALAQIVVENRTLLGALCLASTTARRDAVGDDNLIPCWRRYFDSAVLVLVMM